MAIKHHSVEDEQTTTEKCDSVVPNIQTFVEETHRDEDDIRRSNSPDSSDATVVLQRRKNMSCNFASSSRFFFCIDDKKMLTANMPKAHHVTCTTGTVKQVLNLFYSFAVNFVWKFINLLFLYRVTVSENEYYKSIK